MPLRGLTFRYTGAISITYNFVFDGVNVIDVLYDCDRPPHYFSTFMYSVNIPEARIKFLYMSCTMMYMKSMESVIFEILGQLPS